MHALKLHVVKYALVVVVGVPESEGSTTSVVTTHNRNPLMKNSIKKGQLDLTCNGAIGRMIRQHTTERH
jgi:hypothetical protein